MERIRYTVELKNLHGHRFEVRLLIPARILKGWGAQVQLPAWIPGSYMLRDFSKHLETISAKSIATKKNISLEKIDSNTWFVPPSNHDVTLSYQVYGFDTSVRAAYIDATRAFFNPTSLCLQVLDHADEVHELEILKPTQHISSTKTWRIETTLPAKKIDQSGFGIYQAESYDFLIDHPFAIGEFQTLTWQSCGTPHRMVIQGATKEVDVQQYTFIVNAVGEGYGGLEHSDSTVLLCNRDDLPYPHQNLNKHAAYQDFLGLCSHEYFHAWMIKRIKPKAFIPYTLDQKNHTRLLWLFEGFTSYYDDLQLFRSKRIDLAAYLKRLEKTWNMVLRQPGRQKQSVADSSFDAWTKYYQMDENTPNAVVSYYTKGSLIALALDLVIRQHTRNQQSLDDVIRHLWQMYQLTQEGMAENDFDNAIAFIIGPSFQTTWQSFKSDYIEGTKDLPLMKLLSSAKIKVTSKIKKPSDSPESAKQLLGIRTTVNNGWVKLTHVLDGGLAQLAGLSAGDYLASIQQERVTASRLDQLLTLLMLEIAHGKNVKIIAFRHETAFTVNLSSSPKEMLSRQPQQFSLAVA